MNLFRGKIVILFKLFNDISVKVANWYKFKKKGGVENMLEFCSGWMNIRQKKGGAMIIFLFYLPIFSQDSSGFHADKF